MRWPQVSSANMLMFFRLRRKGYLRTESQQFESNRHVLRIVLLPKLLALLMPLLHLLLPCLGCLFLGDCCVDRRADGLKRRWRPRASRTEYSGSTTGCMERRLLKCRFNCMPDCDDERVRCVLDCQ